MWIELPVLDAVDSTNTYVRDHVQLLPHRSALRTRFQTRGRGQFERSWESNPDENILCSLLLKNVPLGSIEVIRGWIRHTLMEWLRSLGIEATFKLPNDILVNYQKLIGILVETRQSDDLFHWVIIGLGINVNQLVFDIPTATSLRRITSQSFDLNWLYHDILDRLDQTYPLSR